MSVISGIGWITNREYGCVMKQLRRSYSNIGSLRSELQDESVLSYPAKGFGKYDLASKVTCCAAALALYDAGVPYSASRKQDIGILGTNSDACLQSNLDFFEDFVANGRKLGRAKFFVCTLPSIPVAEAAIYFRCQGPLLYMGFPERQVASLLRQSDRMIRRGESAAMLAVTASEKDGQCFVLRQERDVGTEDVFQVDEVSGLAERRESPEELISALTDNWREKNAGATPQANPPRKRRP